MSYDKELDFTQELGREAGKIMCLIGALHNVHDIQNTHVNFDIDESPIG